MPHAMTKYVKERADIDYSTTFFKSAINTFWNYHLISHWRWKLKDYDSTCTSMTTWIYACYTRVKGDKGAIFMTEIGGLYVVNTVIA